MNPHRLSSHLHRRSLRTRFAIRFLHSLKSLSTRKGARRRCQMIKLTAYASMASVVGPQRAWSRASLLKIRRRRATRRMTIKSVLGRKKTTSMKMKKKSSGGGGGGGGGGGTQEEKLRKLVPGGKVMETSILLDETAHYIKCLTQQVMAMRHIVDYCSIN